MRSCTGVTTGTGATGLTGDVALEEALDEALDPASVDARAWFLRAAESDLAVLRPGLPGELESLILGDGLLYDPPFLGLADLLA